MFCRLRQCRQILPKLNLSAILLLLFDKAGCTRQFESELSLRSFAPFFPIKGGSFESPPVLPWTLRVFSKTHQSSLSLKGGSTSHLGLLPSGEKRKPLLLVAQNRYAIRLADHQRSTPAAELRFFVRDKPQGHGDCCWWERRDTMLDAVMIILFIRLWTESTLERFPSGLWQKSYDLHWHLMNDISAYVLYQITQNANLNELILLRYCSYQTKSKVYHSLYRANASNHLPFNI